MVKRTSMNLDVGLVREAARILGTKGTTETVHRALEETIRRQRLARLTDRSFRELSARRLNQLRRSRAAPGSTTERHASG